MWKTVWLLRVLEERTQREVYSPLNFRGRSSHILAETCIASRSRNPRSQCPSSLDKNTILDSHVPRFYLPSAAHWACSIYVRGKLPATSPLGRRLSEVGHFGHLGQPDHDHCFVFAHEHIPSFDQNQHFIEPVRPRVSEMRINVIFSFHFEGEKKLRPTWGQPCTNPHPGSVEGALDTTLGSLTSYENILDENHITTGSKNNEKGLNSNFMVCRRWPILMETAASKAEDCVVSFVRHKCNVIQNAFAHGRHSLVQLYKGPTALLKSEEPQWRWER